MSFIEDFTYDRGKLTTGIQLNTQLGQDIDGEAPGDESGWSVSMNSAGDRVAIGARLNDGSGSDRGHTRIYQWNGSSWTQLGDDIDGEADLDQSGYSVSMNSTGDRVAIGAILNNTSSGHTRIYQWNGSSWTQLGSNIVGEANWDRSGFSVSMNSTGNRVAIGAIFNDGGGNNNSGHTRIYEWNGTNWVQLGFDINGEAIGDNSGHSVSINSAGDRVAIGARFNDGNGNDSGHTRIYEWRQYTANDGSSYHYASTVQNNTTQTLPLIITENSSTAPVVGEYYWTQLGLDIDGEAAGDRSGWSVSMNSAGDRVAIGAIYNDGGGGNSGHTQIYEWDGSSWTQLGSDIDGEAASNQSGYSVSMNSTGDRVAIGAIYNNDNGISSGHTRIYKWNGSSWTQLGNDIDGERNSNLSGWSVSINSAGDRVAIGARLNTNDNGSESGHVRIYQIATYGAQTYAPVYGSSITFTSNNSSWNAGNYNTFVMPNGINNLKAEMNLKFQGGRDRIGPLLLRIENMTTGNIIGNEGLKEIEYKPSFDGSLNDVYVLTGSNEISIPDRVNHGVYIPSNANESIQAYLGTGSNELTRDIVFPFVINADNKTKYKIQFNYQFSGNAGLNYRLYLNENPLRDNFQNIDLSNSTNNELFEYESTFETVGSIKTGYLKFRAVNGAGAEEFSINSTSYINLSNMSMKETYYDTVLNFGDTVNDATINLDNDYYNNFSGSLIEDFELKTIGQNVYEVNVKAINNSNSPLLQNGMAFVNKSNVYAWNSSPREEFDVVSGVANSNVFDNYFYVNGDYDESDSSFLSNISGLYGYTGSYNGATRTFFWEPDQETSIPVSHSNRMNNFKRSFTDQLNIGRNQNRISQLNLTFSNRGQKETYSMLHFLETHLGYKPFVYYYGDAVINRNRVFYCPTWTHTFNYKDSNTITATFVEIPNPTIPKF